jgi:hypothetical protein
MAPTDTAPTSIEISDDILWGKLVKSWATGKSYLDPGKPAPPLPRTLDELRVQCLAIGLTVTFPAVCTGLAIVQYSPETVTIKLPPKAMVEATEARLAAAGAAYPIPRFYDDFYGKALAIPQDRLLDFHAARIGDYSIRNCG